MIDEFLNNFKSTKLENKPFSHKIVNDIFPKAFYDNLLLSLPHLDEYTPIVKTGRVSSNYPAERYIFEINSKSINQLDEIKKGVFRNVLDLFTHPQFFSTIASEFKDTINKRIANFNDEEKSKFGMNNFKFTMSTSLVKDLTKYKLGVHTDTPAKFLTFLFYIPKDSQNSDLGTVLYEPKDKDFNLKNKSTEHYDIKDFNLVKKVKFTPNTLFIFPRTNYSYHGVQKIDNQSVERNLLLLNFYFKEIEK